MGSRTKVVQRAASLENFYAKYHRYKLCRQRFLFEKDSMSATSRRKLSATFWSKILEINRIMGRANGKPVLSDEDMEFIAKHTAVSRDQIDEQYEHFLGKHPNGKITKGDFRHVRT